MRWKTCVAPWKKAVQRWTPDWPGQAAAARAPERPHGLRDPALVAAVTACDLEERVDPECLAQHGRGAGMAHRPGLARDDHHGHAVEIGAGADPVEELAAGHLRHALVEEHDAGRFLRLHFREHLVAGP